MSWQKVSPCWAQSQIWRAKCAKTSPSRHSNSGRAWNGSGGYRADTRSGYHLHSTQQRGDVASSVKFSCSWLWSFTKTLFRDFIRKTLSTYAPDGLSRRFPGANRVRRSALVAIGPNHQHHADGHEKLNAQALGMGGVGLNIYGIKDQWSSFLLHLVVLANNGLASTIGHVYLDCVEKYGGNYELS